MNSGISGIFASAQAGLNAATDRANIRAQNIVNFNTPGYQSVRPIQTADAQSAPRVTAAPPSAPGNTDALSSTSALAISQVNLAEEIVDFRLAQRAFEASALVARTADELLETTLDIKG